MKKQILAVMMLLTLCGCGPGTNLTDILGALGGNQDTQRQQDPYGRGSAQKDPYARRDTYENSNTTNTPVTDSQQRRTDDLRRGRDAASGRSGAYSGSMSSRSFRIAVESGTMNFNGQNLSYAPMGFQIADGERKTIIFRSAGDKKNYLSIPVEVEYRQGVLMFDSNGIRLPYESSWEIRRDYSNLSSGSRSKASGISISVQGTR